MTKQELKMFRELEICARAALVTAQRAMDSAKTTLYAVRDLERFVQGCGGVAQLHEVK